MTKDPQTFEIEAVRSSATAPPRVQECGCDGGGWIVALDRNRYRSPGNAGMLRYTRCLCLEGALSHAQSGAAGVG